MQSRRFVWLGSGVFFILIVVVPGALSDFPDPTTGLPVPGSMKPAVIFMLAFFFAVFLALNLSAIFILTALSKVPRLARIATLISLGLLTIFCLIAAVVAAIVGEGPFIYRYVFGVFPVVTFASMIASWFQTTRTTSSWVTRWNFGLHGLLRFYSMTALIWLFRRSNDEVSWLKHQLHEPAVASVPDLEDRPVAQNPGTAPNRMVSLWRKAIRR